MAKDTLHNTYELALKEPADVCPRGKHQVSFFELVYIVSGTGKQHINNNTVPYAAGNLFLLAPDDSHAFIFETTTQLFFIRFTHIYLRGGTASREQLEKMEIILNNANKEPGCVIKKTEDKATMKGIMQALIYEHQHNALYSNELIAQYIQTILVIVVRNLLLSFPEDVNTQSDRKVLEILQYVQANIYFPEKLKGAAISKKFGISETYLGRYFRKETNETLQEYITRYKLKLIENRLSQSDMRITEIADEFGFTDKSHLNRFFKKLKGATPTIYRHQSSTAR